MAEWESSYGGMFLHNARLLTNEEIKERYPLENNSNMAKLTREFVERGYDILYGENPNLNFYNYLDYNWLDDVIKTAAYLYKIPPHEIIV